MLHQLKKLIPAPFLQAYHLTLAHAADIWYGHPSRKLVIIGVTGTNGKTTTAYYLARALEASGASAGCTTTAIMKIGNKEWINKTKMTMPGRFFLQRMLSEMVKAGCEYAVIETSSQGLIQHRHVGIAYDIGVFTNLTPEHIEAHGGFENYKKAKRLLFEHLAKLPEKILKGKTVPRASVINADSPHGNYYAEGIEEKRWYGIENHRGLYTDDIELPPDGARMTVKDAHDASLALPMRLNQPGEYNILNALAALAVCQTLGVDLGKAVKKLEEVTRVPGRFERIEAGQSFTAIVDYAPEPESFRQLYRALSSLPRERTIHVLGSCGGGRDVARRPILGELAAANADIVIVTNEDPYDDNPREIIEQVAEGARKAGKIEGQNLFLVDDRADAIRKAMGMAKGNDLVVMTGKGCEPWICTANGSKIPWDEAETAKQAIKESLNNT